MEPIRLSRQVRAPLTLVFEAVSNVDVFSRALPQVLCTEYLSERRSGVGTRFRETRLVHGKPTITDLEIIEYVANERIRVVADTRGTLWDSEFSVAPHADTTLLALRLGSRAACPWPRIMDPVMRAMLGRALGRDLDALRDFCEAARSQQ